MYFFLFWLGYVTLIRDASICSLKPLLGKSSQTTSLLVGLNRISWKPDTDCQNYQDVQDILLEIQSKGKIDVGGLEE
ncbi:MAG: hypothetical protein F6K21_21355 [Symploca sp. SIO2D2]|nr:hypothetical protein [Symploca sp. SIO2D2]